MGNSLIGSGALLAILVATPAAAAIVLPTSYEVQQPNNGSFSYQDDSYNGTNVAGFLSGGTGDLTNGIIAAARWNVTPGPWVGWSSVNPEIVFRFAPGTVIDTIDFYFDDAGGLGGVTLPQGVDLADANGAIAAAPVITTDGIVGRYSYDIGGIALDALSATLIRNSQWVMLSEVTFNGSNPVVGPAPIPEPGSWAMLIAGFGMVGAVARRRRQNPGVVA